MYLPIYNQEKINIMSISQRFDEKILINQKEKKRERYVTRLEVVWNFSRM